MLPEASAAEPFRSAAAAEPSAAAAAPAADRRDASTTGYPSARASAALGAALLVLHLDFCMQLDRLQSSAALQGAAKRMGEWWVGPTSALLEYVGWLAVLAASLWHATSGGDLAHQLEALLALYEREALHPSEDATGRARSLAEAHVMRDDPLRRYQRQLLRDVVLPDVHRAGALLLLALLFLALAAQASYLQLAVSDAAAAERPPNPLAALSTLVGYVAVAAFTGLGLMRSAAGGDRRADGERAPPPNPNPLRDYPHGYQPWLTPGLNWGY